MQQQTNPAPSAAARERIEASLNRLHDDYRRQIAKLQRQAEADVRSIWDDSFSFPTAEDRVEQVQRTLRRYNDAASARARDYYNAIRMTWEKETGASMPDLDPGELMDPNETLWTVMGGFNDRYPGLHYEDVIPDASGRVHNKYGANISDLWPKHDDLDRYIDLVKRITSTSGRLTTLQLIGRDPTKPKWARVPNGPTCEFCVMLASRGFVYLTEQTARLGGSFHNGHCDCSIVPSWSKVTIDGYDPATLRKQYEDCSNAVATLTTRTRYQEYVDSYAPRNDDDKPRGYEQWKRGIELAEMRWRDRTWLNTGTPPAVGYNPPELQRKISDIRPHEIRTAQRLADNGVKATFKIDVKKVPNENGKGTHDIGYADLENGIEIKTLKNTSSTNTINSHLKSTSKKPDAKTVVMDNSENDGMSDEDLIACIRRCLAFRDGKVYIIRHDGKLTRAR